MERDPHNQQLAFTEQISSRLPAKKRVEDDQALYKLNVVGEFSAAWKVTWLIASGKDANDVFRKQIGVRCE